MANEMTDKDAKREARRRWGAKAFALCVQYGYRDDQCEYRVGHTTDGYTLRGKSEQGYREAFEDATKQETVTA